MTHTAATETTLTTTTQHGTDALVVRIAATPAAEAAAVAFLRRHTAWEMGQRDYRVHFVDDVATDAGAELIDYLFPTCSHGMSASLCAGPDHYMTADQERAMGW